jgi:hypothetical protein
MSGPLGDWFLAHAPKGIGVHARAVGLRFCLKANHHGEGADLAVDVLADDLDMSPGGVRSKIRLLEELGLLREEAPPRPGKGNVTPRTVVIRWCDPLCWICCLLLDQQQRKGAPGDPFSEQRTTSKRVTGDAKRVTPRRQKGHPVTPLRNGDVPPEGGTSPSPESDAALAPAGAAPEPGQSGPASNGEPARIRREDWYALVNPGRPQRPRSTAEERAAEEEHKRARALHLLRVPGQDPPPAWEGSTGTDG